MDTVGVVVDMVANRADTVVVDSAVADVKADKLATLAVVTATCLVRSPHCQSPTPANNPQVTAPKAKSATTAVKSAISPATAHPRPPPSELATSASNPATSKPSALTKQNVR